MTALIRIINSVRDWYRPRAARRGSVNLARQILSLRAIRHTRLFMLSIVCAPCFVGCVHVGLSHNGVIGGPDDPKALTIDSQANATVVTEIKNFYYNRCLLDATPLPGAPLATPSPNCGTKREQRDTIIYDLKRIIDHNYDQYARHFQQTSDTTSFVGEVGAASLTAVGTLVGATDLKNILTTASTLTQSTNVSIQKDFFQKQTEYAILAEMDADRSKQWSTITQLMVMDDVNTYSLSAALDDLQQYKRVGTATAALTSLTQQAGAQKQGAVEKTNTTLGIQ